MIKVHFLLISDAVSKFFFKYPPHMRKSRLDKAGGVLEFDEDGDLLLDRNEEGTILIGEKILFGNYSNFLKND